MLNLLNHLSTQITDRTTKQNIGFDFPPGVTVTFAKNISPITPSNDTSNGVQQTVNNHRKLVNGKWYHIEVANTYEDLEDVPLTSEEQKIVEAEKEKINQIPHFYDGDNIFISGMMYNPEENKVYIEAKKGKYSLLSSLKSGKFAEGSPIYEQHLLTSGTAAPFITNDGYTALLERKDGRYYSNAGYLEPKMTADHHAKYLNFPGGSSLIEFTATTEAIEEALGDQSSTKSRAPMSFPSIESLQFRYGGTNDKGQFGSIEWIAPIHLGINKDQLVEILKTNRSPDAFEHTQNFEVIPLGKERAYEMQHFMDRKLKGSEIYAPVIASASQKYDTYTQEQSSSLTPQISWQERVGNNASNMLLRNKASMKQTLHQTSNNDNHNTEPLSKSFVSRISNEDNVAKAYYR